MGIIISVANNKGGVSKYGKAMSKTIIKVGNIRLNIFF